MVDNVEQNLDKIAERVKQLVKIRKSEALKDILRCINKIIFDEMSFLIYKQDESDARNHLAASIHKVVLFKFTLFIQCYKNFNPIQFIQYKEGYQEVLCVIYLEVATRMGITCKPIHLDSSFCSENLILSCQ